jgi:glycosyltransferase involved in cell wall biosynthesis
VTDYTAGAFTSTLRFAEKLSQRGHKVIFIAARTSFNKDMTDYKGMKIYRFRSVMIPRTERKSYAAFPTPYEMRSILTSEEIDLLYVLMPLPSAVVAMNAARSLGIKTIVHSHSQPENVSHKVPVPLSPLTYLVNATLMAYLNRLYRRSQAIVYPTEFAQQIFEHLNKEIPHRIISNGIDTGRFSRVDPKPFIDKWRLPSKNKHVLYVGRLHPEKSVDTLIKAIPRVVQRHPHTHFLIVGPGYQQEELERLARHLEISTYVTFCGRVSDEELIQAYSVSDVFVLPSLAELEGMVVLEAMACGNPIIVAEAPNSASRFLVSDNGLLFRPQDSGHLFDQISYMLSNDSARTKMAEASLRQSKKYDIEKSIDALEEVFYSVLETK